MPSSDSRTADVNHDTVGESRSAAELAVRRYVPNSLRPDHWAAISEFTVDIALRLGASHPKRAIESMRTLSQFIHWARTQGLPLDVELIFDPDTVEGYIAGGCPHLAASSRATRRAYLRSYGRQITTTAPWPPSIRPLRQDYAVVPYSDAEVARLLEVAASQRTTTQRRHLQALLALGLGAGLFPKESWSVTSDDLMEKHGVLCLTVPGDRPRVVPILPPHDDTLRAICRDDPGSTLLGYVAPEWDRSRLSNLLGKSEFPPGTPVIKLHRLRATWFLHHMRNLVPLNELSKVAGLSTAKTFGHLMRYLPDLPEAEVFAQMTRR